MRGFLPDRRSIFKMSLETVWVFGDQLNRHIGALQFAHPDTHQILLVESRSKIASRPWHVQRAHFMIASMRRFADELRQKGFEVDYQQAESMSAGCKAIKRRTRHHALWSLNLIVIPQDN